MLRITCVVFVLAVVAMVSCNREALTKAVIQASGNPNLSEGKATLYRDAEGMAESCDTGMVATLGGVSYSEAGDSADDALAFASKLGAELADASSVACEGYKCPDGNVIGACAFA
ncbi:uncharacterized protein LOC124275461 [Haliotis rubra]|uniref:uncharacterized protein LOC124275461 n=1 Tax=Haliotis rubra TaxID=36100 RepID=UPI001EE5F1C6|nr:uncharacterized protein LOC124275461 [Haliotis rubra]